jgi:hypothetical protein
VEQAISHPDRRRRDGVRGHINQLIARKIKLVAESAEDAGPDQAQLLLQLEAIDQQVERLVEAVRRQSTDDGAGGSQVVSLRGEPGLYPSGANGARDPGGVAGQPLR